MFLQLCVSLYAWEVPIFPTETGSLKCNQLAVLYSPLQVVCRVRMMPQTSFSTVLAGCGQWGPSVPVQN